ncbi:hypothetical protein [Deinococcus sp. Leaf326]|uniref:hypothetical protein n=1 Tax=Deinococcus sp. Leaf326 TaxID=1736338 RepID=UPI0006FA29AB|nr:hypothetical protein [Deinococcus sp. Leaf326]KQR37765.1 hypothetical protein ASF71_14890 [Deinococcus sp. Leaf326]
MTLFEASPSAPAPETLTETLMRLLSQSREDGSQPAHTLEDGLRLRVGTAEGEFIALSRPGGRPTDEDGQHVAQATGWLAWSTSWEERGHRWYLVLKPEDPPLIEAPVKAKAKDDAEPPPPPEDPEFPDDAIRAALVDRTAPWRAGLSPWGMDIRDDVVKGMKRAELLEEISWLRRKFGPQLQAWKRARIAAALA